MYSIITLIITIITTLTSVLEHVFTSLKVIFLLSILAPFVARLARRATDDGVTNDDLLRLSFGIFIMLMVK